MPKTFVLNNEQVVNCYGFRVPNGSLSLTRFKANPVMLAEHFNSVGGVIGKWNNLRVEGSELLADAEFDTEDEDSNKIAGKVERGFLKGASIGFLPLSYVMAADGVPDLQSGELMEASVCAIPANSGAVVRLYSNAGELMADDAVKLSLSIIAPVAQPNTQTIENSTMKGLALSLVALTALGFTEALKEGDEGRLSAAINQLAADLDQEKKAHQALKSQFDTVRKSQSKNAIAAALAAGKITAADVPEYEELGAVNHEILLKTLERLPAATNLNGQVSNPTGGTGPKTMDEFEKLSLNDQLAFKKSNPDAYKKLFA